MSTEFKSHCDQCGKALKQGQKLDLRFSFDCDVDDYPTPAREKPMRGWSVFTNLSGQHSGDYCSWTCATTHLARFIEVDKRAYLKASA